MARYRSQPSIIHAARWEQTWDSRREIEALAGSRVLFDGIESLVLLAGRGQGSPLSVDPGDWIAADHENEDFWPVAHERFEAVYDKIDDQRPDLPA